MIITQYEERSKSQEKDGEKTERNLKGYFYRHIKDHFIYNYYVQNHN